jgi:hypothetical protein
MWACGDVARNATRILKGRSAPNWSGRRSGRRGGDSKKKRKPSTGQRNVRSFVLIRKATVTTVHPWQVYVTRTGKLFHTQWCSIMDGQWRAGQRGIYETMMADVGPRGRCTQCDRNPEVMKRSKFEQAEWRRLNQELDRLGRTIARTLVAKGPEGVNGLGPHVIRFRDTEAELNKLSSRVAGVFPDSYDARN